jgi:glycosyltransferase involved in cell wall biosynthesis
MEQFGELARKARFSLEVVLVDDGSTDQTLPRAVEAQEKHRFLRIIALPHRRGLTEALRAGFSVARGQIIVFYPADRQFHPADKPRMVEKVRSGYDLVTGRKIGFYNKKFVSSFYNRLSRWLFPSIKVSDLNSVKAFKRELVEVFDYRHDWHRFWVAIVAEAGYRIGEVDVTLYQRGSGRSKFGFWRIPGGVLDLLAVKFQYHTMRRPLWYFGITGIFMLAAGFIVGLIAIYQRFVEGHGYRPFVYLVMSLGLAGVVFFAIGFLAEAVAGLRQQLDTLKPAPKYHVYKPGGPEGGGFRRPQESRQDQRPERRESNFERRREQDRPDRQQRRDRGPRRDEHPRPDRASTPAPKQEVQPEKFEREAVASLLPTEEITAPEPEIRSTPEEKSVASEQEPEVPAGPMTDDAGPATASEDRVSETDSSPSEPQPERRTNLYGRRKRN